MVCAVSECVDLADIDRSVSGQLIPPLRQISATGIPASPCFKMNAFGAPVNFEALTQSRDPGRSLVESVRLLT
jgi:hypothetical protein